MKKKNLEEQLEDISYSIGTIANSITPRNAPPSEDASGTGVGSLTESIMGVTSGLMSIALAIGRLADVIEETEQ